ncbi:MAG: hypothetical protein LBC45_03565 [Chlamydiales bacterium]|nr:hypothetical protein [Chlamydiales bacterium]
MVCKYDPASRGGGTPDGRKVRGTLHWVSKQDAVNAEIRLYENLFNRPDPEGNEDLLFTSCLSEKSLKVLKNCKLEQWIVNNHDKERFQFLRMGYFCVDNTDYLPEAPVFNRIVTLKDSYGKTLCKL